jgi:hypothetical protein
MLPEREGEYATLRANVRAKSSVPYLIGCAGMWIVNGGREPKTKSRLLGNRKLIISEGRKKTTICKCNPSLRHYSLADIFYRTFVAWNEHVAEPAH